MGTIRFSQFAASNPGALAIVDPQERAYSRGTLAALSNRITRGLRRNGHAPGNVLALAAPNCFEFVAAYLAAMQTGLYVVPLNWHLAPSELRYILEDCKATVLVAHERLRPLVSDTLRPMSRPPRHLLSIGEIDGFVPIDRLIHAESADPVDTPVVGRVLSYTSATTGRPKGVHLPLSGASQALDMSIERRMAFGIELEAHTHLCASMLYHGLPLEAVYVGLHMGHTVVLAEILAPEAMLSLIERYHVTNAAMVPSVFPRLLNLGEDVRSRYSLRSLERITHGGAPCRIDVKHRMIDWLGPILWETYGATEGVGTAVGSIDWLKYPGTVGKPISGSRVKILSDDGEELPPGEIGTIYLTRYTGDRFSYLGDPEKTRACHRGDFFTVGDVGYLNEEGFLFLCDRKTDMIILSGMKVYAAEIENALALHPSVVDCAVFGVPDELMGEAVAAIVQPAPGVTASPELRSDILRFLRQRISRVKVPQRIVFTEQLPREPTGKLPKRRLREICRELQ